MLDQKKCKSYVEMVFIACNYNVYCKMMEQNLQEDEITLFDINYDPID